MILSPKTLPSGGPAFDLLLVGGGLQNALIALAVLDLRPNASLALLEAEGRVAGNHTWSFHAGDVPERARSFIEPLIAHRWAGYDVAFPGLDRHVAEAYCAISSERLRAVITERIGAAPNALLLTGARATDVAAEAVVLSDGRRFTAQLVVDARGPGRFVGSGSTGETLAGRATGYQKFVGLELELEPGTPMTRTNPFLMDALVPQTDGFRFFYVLPMGATRVLIEDTYFSDSPTLDLPTIRAEILAYARRSGLAVRAVVREEQGALPLPTRGISAPLGQSPLVAGYAGGWFHPATGYSFPTALRLALHIAESPAGSLFGSAWADLAREHSKQFRFAALLNRLLFTAFSPAHRWHALARFYGQPEATIRRFYALETTATDRLRLLCGTPPSGLSVRAAWSRGAFV